MGRKSMKQPLLSGGAGSDAGDSAAAYRTVLPNQLDRQAEFCDNVVITSHYTALNFVPKFLLEQFTRFANAYFLTVSILQMIPAVSITNGVPSSLVPLSFVLLFDAIVTAREDYQRHQADAADNARPTLVLDTAGRTPRWVPTPWRSVRVGDIVKVRRGETFPADILFLRAFTDDNTSPEACYVQTAQLDGETNLKLRTALPDTVERFTSEEALASYTGQVRAEAPNGIFGRFSATIEVVEGEPAVPLEADQILLRGCVLRNVSHIFGIVMYTGPQTKVRVKQTTHSRKRAQVEKMVNKQIVFLVSTLLMVCLAGTIGYYFWTNANITKAWYLELTEVTFGRSVLRLLTFFLLNSNFIPVSLYVSMKLARTAQKFFMEKDLGCYYEDPDALAKSGGKSGHFPLKVRSMDLNDELGQITHIFSDKTGTFTLNYMEFRKVSIHGVSYGLGTTEIGIDRMRREGVEGVEELAAMMAREALATPGAHRVPHVNFHDGSDSHKGRTITGDLADGDVEAPGTPAYHVHTFLLHMVLNHTVVPEKIRNDAGEVIDTQLSASSPDEEAFVCAGKFFGYEFVNRSSDELQLRIAGVDKTFHILHILAYNQRRKRMSVLVRDDRGRLRLYVKGADTVIMERLEEGAVPPEVEEATSQHLAGWGNDGLRTLCFAYRDVEEEYYADWSARYLAARGSVEEIEKRKQHQPNLIDACMEEIETGLTLHGATANEDKLQPGVPETIATLARAGIRIWMLTGDKQETAVNIGYATRMLNDNMEHLILTVEEHGSVEAVMHELRKVDLRARGRDAPPLALVIDEKALDAAVEAPLSRAKLLDVSCACTAVICCRARPDQKAEMVRMIREGVPGARTLAVGDGANDVDMIQTAHVGVGIAGAEGVQAANASDYAIGRFRFLQRLLLVHGRSNYRRMSKLVCYMFYKNITMVLTQFWFAAMSGYSGQKFFVELALQTYNLVYTGPAVLMLGFGDQDVSPENAIRYPALYKCGPSNEFFNLRVFSGWILSAVVESIMIYAICLYGLLDPAMADTTLSVFGLGSVMFGVVVVVVNIRIAVETHLHHWTYSAVVFLSIASWWPACFIFDALDANGVLGVMSHIYGSATVWLTMLVAVAACVLRIIFWKMWKRYHMSSLRHVVQEVQLVTKRHEALDKWVAAGEAAEIARRSGRRASTLASPAPSRPVSITEPVGAGAGSGAGSGSGVRPDRARLSYGSVSAYTSSRTLRSGADFSHDDSHAEYHADKLSRHGHGSAYHTRFLHSSSVASRRSAGAALLTRDSRRASAPQVVELRTSHSSGMRSHDGDADAALALAALAVGPSSIPEAPRPVQPREGSSSAHL